MTVSAIEKQDQSEMTRAERTRSRRTFRPNVDIIEREDELTVLADMPGACDDDIDIRFENAGLTIFGRTTDRQPEETDYLSREFAVGDFVRSFQVSENIDIGRISAEYTDGVLTLHLPKTEKAKPRRISVKTA
ncbi:MAG: Hsp20/alpha crystallin family protein [Gemmatimonadota bacterium]|nr:MAG: Hsp20/alpha crystallin family protein [Gemmatimonadota bacterium]